MAGSLLDLGVYTVADEGLAQAPEAPKASDIIEASPLDTRNQPAAVKFVGISAIAPSDGRFVASLRQLAEAVPLLAGRAYVAPAATGAGRRLVFALNNQGIAYRVSSCSLTLEQFSSQLPAEVMTCAEYKLAKLPAEPPFAPSVDRAGLAELAAADGVGGPAAPPLLAVALTRLQGGGACLAYDFSHAATDAEGALAVLELHHQLLNGAATAPPRQLAARVRCGREWIAGAAASGGTQPQQQPGNGSLGRGRRQQHAEGADASLAAFCKAQQRGLQGEPWAAKLRSAVWWSKLKGKPMTQRVLVVPNSDLVALQAAVVHALPAAAGATATDCLNAAVWLLVAHARGLERLRGAELAISLRPRGGSDDGGNEPPAIANAVLQHPVLLQDQRTGPGPLIHALMAAPDPTARRAAATKATAPVAAALRATAAAARDQAPARAAAALEASGSWALSKVPATTNLWLHKALQRCDCVIHNMGASHIGASPGQCVHFGARGLPPFVVHTLRTATCVHVHVALPAGAWSKRLAAPSGRMLVGALLPGARWLGDE